MKIRREIGILVGIFFMLVIPAMADNLPIKAVIDEIQKNYEKIDDLKADFVQESTIKALKKTEREEGIFYFKNPQRMFWNYSKPKEKKLIINPKKAWLYVPEDRIVYLQDTKSIFKSKIIMKFLSGVGKLGDDFQVYFSQPDFLDRSGNYLLTLIPKDSRIGVKKLFLTIDKDHFHIIQCRFADDYGNVTQIRFKDIKINNQLSNDLFIFKPPAGVDLVNAP